MWLLLTCGTVRETPQRFQDRDKKRKILYMQVAPALSCPQPGCNMQRQNTAELKREDGKNQFSFDAQGKNDRTTRL